MFTPSHNTNTSVKPHRHELQNFERIRARWELIQPGEGRAGDMGGKRDKQAVQPPVDGQLQANNASKFRRKLSYGLSFISNPLSQRKTTPGRQTARVPSLAAHEQTTSNIDATGEAEPGRRNPLSPTPITKSSVCSEVSSTEITALADHADEHMTPRDLPRSRTFSFIPRPVSLQTLAANADMRESVGSVALAPLAESPPNAPPSKIPTPSPPPFAGRATSPRQYLSARASQQIKHMASAQAFEARSNGPVAKAAMRSQTTPNLLNVINSARPTNFSVPKKSALKKVETTSPSEIPHLQENIYDPARVTPQRSHPQERPSRRESQAVLGATSHRRSYGPAVSRQSRKVESATPQAERKRISEIATLSTPVAAKRSRPKGHVRTPESDIVQVTGNSSFARSRLMGPKDPPTPTPSIDFKTPALPLLNPRAEYQRKRLGTPNGLAGAWRSSRALAASNHEVRKLPRSSTFHGFRGQESPPPIPPIPEQYRTASLAQITNYRRPQMESSAKRPQPKRGKSNAASAGSGSEPPVDGKYRFISKSSTVGTKVPCNDDMIRIPDASTDTGTVYTACPPGPSSTGTQTDQPSLLSLHAGTQPLSDAGVRPWLINEQPNASNANIDTFVQVKDYMQPLYWAGRFQSRFDQWRTEAMKAQLDPSHVRTGPMRECNLDQENLASYYIFGQLRELCTSNQAADSLWEFEHKYRKDHKLLDNPLDLPEILPSRKQDEKISNQQGAFGRAVRKLTPRKSSLANIRNLLKGKAKGEEEKSDGVSDGVADASSADT